jgi:hypothetical protein
MRKYLPLLLVLALLLFAAVPAQAVTVSWNFASGLDHRNFEFTTNLPTDIFLDDSSGNLRIHSNYFGLSGIYGGWINSLFKVRGDFEISVDYQLNKPMDYGSFVQFFVPDYVLVRPYDNYHVYIGYWPPCGWPTSDMSATIRFIRIGSNVSTYVNNDLVYTYYGYGTGDVDFAFGPHADRWGGGSLDVSFDNLKITAASLVGYKSPFLPAILSLLLGD